MDRKTLARPLVLVLPCLLSIEAVSLAGEPAVCPRVLTDFAQPLAEGTAIATDAEIGQDRGTLLVRTRHAAERPGVTLKGPGGRWNLTGFTELETTVKNLGKHALTVHCAVDGAEADRAARRNCCIGSVNIPPGEAAVLKVDIRARLPESLREKLRGMRGTPGGFASGDRSTIDPTDVRGISVYVYRPAVDHVFEVSNLRAGGSPAFPLPENVDDLFPMIDAWGQYKHKDWPGKIHSEHELVEQRTREAADLAALPGPQDWNQYGGWLGGPTAGGDRPISRGQVARQVVVCRSGGTPVLVARAGPRDLVLRVYPDHRARAPVCRIAQPRLAVRPLLRPQHVGRLRDSTSGARRRTTSPAPTCCESMVPAGPRRLPTWPTAGCGAGG